jgi:hypothetical protein
LALDSSAARARRFRGFENQSFFDDRADEAFVISGIAQAPELANIGKFGWLDV